jgi:hypothetical protein
MSGKTPKDIFRRSRTHDQMVQAVRSGKQDIAEGSMASGTSKKTELKLVGVARASLEELLLLVLSVVPRPAVGDSSDEKIRGGFGFYRAVH